LPTLSASLLLSALTWLWTENPVWRQLRIFCIRGSPMSFFRSSREKTSRVKILSSRPVAVCRITWMRIIAFITDYAVVDRIINHLKLTFVAERPPPPHLVWQEFLMDSEAPADYFEVTIGNKLLLSHSWYPEFHNTIKILVYKMHCF